MALFNKKTEKKEDKKTDTKAVVAKSAPAQAVSNVRNRDLSRFLRRPRITEKATFAAEKGVYVFEIDPRAGKQDVIDAVEAFYKVKPRQIRIAQIPEKKKQSQLRRTKGVRSGGKKAYVYLKKGDTIEVL